MPTVDASAAPPASAGLARVGAGRPGSAVGGSGGASSASKRLATALAGSGSGKVSAQRMRLLRPASGSLSYKVPPEPLCGPGGAYAVLLPPWIPDALRAGGGGGCGGQAAGGAPKGLGVEHLFEEVIQRSSTHGPFLQEIKEAYDGFLKARGAAVPDTRIAELRIGREAAAGPLAAVEDEGPAGLAVQAARREALGLDREEGDDWDISEEEVRARIQLLERDNAALRSLAGRFREDLAASPAEDDLPMLEGASPSAAYTAAYPAAASAAASAAVAAAGGGGCLPPMLPLMAGPSKVPPLAHLAAKIERLRAGTSLAQPSARDSAQGGTEVAEGSISACTTERWENASECGYGSGRAWLVEAKACSPPLNETHAAAQARGAPLGARPRTVPALDFDLLRCAEVSDEYYEDGENENEDYGDQPDSRGSIEGQDWEGGPPGYGDEGFAGLHDSEAAEAWASTFASTGSRPGRPLGAAYTWP